MNFLQTLKDLLIRFTSIDKNITALEEAVAVSDDNMDELDDKLQNLSNRVLVLESTSATKTELQELRERVSKLEVEQTAYLREARAATAELVAERKGLAADAREIITQIQTNPPQLPPVNPTDN